MLGVAGAVQALGATGLFASRAFLPALVTALVLRFGPDIPVLSLFVDSQASYPAWMTHDATLVVLGILAGLEVAASKNEDLRELLNQADYWVKPVVAALLAFGLIQAEDAEAVQGIVQSGVASGITPLVVGGGVFLAARLRKGVLDQVSVLDPGDQLGLQRLLSWAEDGWCLFGALVLVAFPLIMLGMTALVLMILALIRRRLEKKAEASKVPCPRCGRPNFPMALSCAQCGGPFPHPVDVGFFGQPRQDRQANPRILPFRLLEKKRCPACASLLKKNTPHQACADCGRDPSSSPNWFEEYLHRIDRRLPRVVLVTALLSLLPALGVIPGIILYRYRLVLPLKYYTPAGWSILARWGARLLSFILLLFQWVPLVGGFSLPLMALVNYGAYRRAFTRSLGPAMEPMPPAQE